MKCRRKLPIIQVDADPMNADWLRSRWPLEYIPPYKSEAFMKMLRSWGMTLEEFRELPLYSLRFREAALSTMNGWSETRPPSGRGDTASDKLASAYQVSLVA